MVRPLAVVRETWDIYTPVERRNIALYIAGIMTFKFGLEAFNGSVIALATNRYDELEKKTHVSITFQRVGILTGLNQAFQCVGSILIAPLIKRYPTKNVLACAVLIFGFMSSLLLILDAATGGKFAPKGHPKDDFSYYGDYNTDGMIPIFCVCGVVYGMVELIRRVIPRDLVGGNIQKLRRMDSLVHIFYEISGTAGAFCTALALIPHFGNNFSFIITPIFFAAASILWYFIEEAGVPRDTRALPSEAQPSYVKAVIGIIFTHRKFVWLLPGYAVALYGHRYLENAIAPAIARRYLGNSAWSQIMVGGSNFGELLGALFVFMFTNMVHTPIPWLRIDALALLIVWYLPFWFPPKNDVGQAWIVAATFLPISFGWAAGDVSLAAYIQASLARIESETQNVSALGAVMAFLYSSYIVTYAIASVSLGTYIDRVSDRNNEQIQPAILNVAGVQFTIIFVLVMASTFVPKGAFSLNPRMLSEEELDTDLEDEDLEYVPGVQIKSKQSLESHEMVRAGGVTTPQADLLASKSNYELISSGQHLEMGLHFSTAMATGVMMKRATHRAAEQARRDRMKNAMVDLAEFLLDGEVTFGSGTTCFVVMRGKDGEDGSEKGEAKKESEACEKKTVNKARLIEMALEKMRAQEKEIEMLRKQVEELRPNDPSDRMDET
ncbi:major facilitator superfamily domain-containing protein [Pyrenochaeta sp. MPI-SDFR-AT-0127]|nr:major facilitator superfamily domain-containing protein [Pyrenochaeta sp. MPI-SDFR-AT-0127]